MLLRYRHNSHSVDRLTIARRADATRSASQLNVRSIRPPTRSHAAASIGLNYV
jgi:hypothetical protein